MPWELRVWSHAVLPRSVCLAGLYKQGDLGWTLLILGVWNLSGHSRHTNITCLQDPPPIKTLESGAQVSVAGRRSCTHIRIHWQIMSCANPLQEKACSCFPLDIAPHTYFLCWFCCVSLHCNKPKPRVQCLLSPVIHYTKSPNFGIIPKTPSTVVFNIRKIWRKQRTKKTVTIVQLMKE